MPARNSAVTKTKHDSKKKKKPQKSKTKKPNSFLPSQVHISAQPVLWLPMWPQLLIWSCLPLRPGWPSPGVSRRLIAVFHLSIASFWARGQHFLTPTASSGLAEVRPKPDYEIFQGLWVLAFPRSLVLFFQLENQAGVLCKHLSILSYMSCSVTKLAIQYDIGRMGNKP